GGHRGNAGLAGRGLLGSDASALGQGDQEIAVLDGRLPTAFAAGVCGEVEEDVPTGRKIGGDELAEVGAAVLRVKRPAAAGARLGADRRVSAQQAGSRRDVTEPELLQLIAEAHGGAAAANPQLPGATGRGGGRVTDRRRRRDGIER